MVHLPDPRDTAEEKATLNSRNWAFLLHHPCVLQGSVGNGWDWHRGLSSGMGQRMPQVQDISQLPRHELVLSFQTGTMESLRKLVLAPTWGSNLMSSLQLTVAGLDSITSKKSGSGSNTNVFGAFYFEVCFRDRQLDAESQFALYLRAVWLSLSSKNTQPSPLTHVQSQPHHTPLLLLPSAHP